ncbi:hypothetical protein PHMEG_00021108 [Phytophthora megakarya]|uniref:WRKY19-like zinc finger domain-containing protein n=1 Tax=Phytophthora megakarya TaxID=4795 RepID=A0A225VMG6_9STRA|nr:hypothetical protein PHMEG_00021108 [Phytophthora megakarya]
METILAPLDLPLGKDMWKHPQSPLNPETNSPSNSNLVRLPSLFAVTGSAATTSMASEWSPRLLGMNDVLSQVSPIKEKGLARLPSIGLMINREATPESLSPVQKHCMDLYKQLQDTKTASPRQPELELNSLLADAAVSQLNEQTQKMLPALNRTNDKFRRSSNAKLCGMAECNKRAKAAAVSQLNEQTQKMLPAFNRTNDKFRRSSNAKLCGMAECNKRAKAGGFCIAHGGGLRCSEAGCTKHAVSLGLCISHGGGKRCTVEGCLNASRKNGVCWSHGGKRLCKLEGCNKGPKAGGYCWSHGGKMKK